MDVISWNRFTPAAKMQQFAAAEGVRLFVVGQYRQWDMTMPATMNIMEWLYETEQYDLVWGHYLFPAGFLAVWFSLQHGLKSTVSARGNDFDREIFPPGDFSRLLWTLQNAKSISAVSQDMSKKIVNVSGRQDVQVLRNVVDSELFDIDSDLDTQQRRQDHRIAADELVLGFSGELREKKGLQFLLEALTEVRKQLPACLFVIGEVRLSQRDALQLYESEFPHDAAR